jgi:hypothetical protein
MMKLVQEEEGVKACRRPNDENGTVNIIEALPPSAAPRISDRHTTIRLNSGAFQVPEVPTHTIASARVILFPLCSS